MFKFHRFGNDIVQKNGQFWHKHHAECCSCHIDLTVGIPQHQPVRFEDYLMCDHCNRTQVIIQKYLKDHLLNSICRNTPPQHIHKLFLMANNWISYNMFILMSHNTLLPPYKVCLRISLDQYNYMYSITI